jgi:hypothetical protein
MTMGKGPKGGWKNGRRKEEGGWKGDEKGHQGRKAANGLVSRVE